MMAVQLCGVVVEPGEVLLNWAFTLLWWKWQIFGVGLAWVPKHSGAPVALLQRGTGRRQAKGWIRLQMLKQGIYKL